MIAVPTTSRPARWAASVSAFTFSRPPLRAMPDTGRRPARSRSCEIDSSRGHRWRIGRPPVPNPRSRPPAVTCGAARSARASPAWAGRSRPGALPPRRVDRCDETGVHTAGQHAHDDVGSASVTRRPSTLFRDAGAVRALDRIPCRRRAPPSTGSSRRCVRPPPQGPAVAPRLRAIRRRPSESATRGATSHESPLAR